MRSQQEKAAIFKLLHEQPGCFVIPNPWDAGSAKLLANLGFEALATTSAGLAFVLGRRDGKCLVSRDEALSNAHEIVSATELPVSADLENGYEDDPVGVSETIKCAGEVGLVGASIEDATGNPDNPIYEFGLAVERVRAASEAAKEFSFPFLLTARAENYLHGRPDINDTIRRLQAFQEAGADVLYAPGLKTRADIAAVVDSVDRPVNVVMGLQGLRLSIPELAELGVKRVSVGSSLNRVALGAFLKAAGEIKQHGTFSFSDAAVSSGDLDEIFGKSF